MTATETNALKKKLLARFKEENPHAVGENLGFSAFMLVMFAHGYSKPQKAKLAALEKALKAHGGVKNKKPSKKN